MVSPNPVQRRHLTGSRGTLVRGQGAQKTQHSPLANAGGLPVEGCPKEIVQARTTCRMPPSPTRGACRASEESPTPVTQSGRSVCTTVPRGAPPAARGNPP